MTARRSGTQRGATRLRPSLAVFAWCGATAVAVAVVWLGVDSVLMPVAGPAPAAVSVGSASGTPGTVPSPPPRAGATGTSPGGDGSGTPSPPQTSKSAPPTGAPSAPVTRHQTTGPGSGSGSGSASGHPTPPAGGGGTGGGTEDADGTPTRYQMPGGIVVLDVAAHTVSFVSATPAAGYAVQEWSTAGLIRVDFTEGDTVYSLYATWNGYSPQVQMYGPDGPVS